MSTIVEHLAAMEMFKTLGEHEQFHSEVYLFTQVHWAELIAQQDPAAMQQARLAIEKRMVDQHGLRGQTYVNLWRLAQPVVHDARTVQSAPAERLPLTDDQIERATSDIHMNAPGARWNIARAIERAHDITVTRPAQGDE